MLCLSGFELYPGWVPLRVTLARGLPYSIRTFPLLGSRVYKAGKLPWR